MSRSAFQKAMKAMPAFRNLMHAYVQAFNFEKHGDCCASLHPW
jgi:hypothetical protein